MNAEASDTAEQSGLVDDLRQLAADGRILLEAELAYQKSRAAVVGQAAKSVAGWGVLALALVFFALVAMVLGLLLALADLLGPWGAMGAVAGGLLAGAALAAWIAVHRWQRTAAQLAERDEPA